MVHKAYPLRRGGPALTIATLNKLLRGHCHSGDSTTHDAVLVIDRRLFKHYGHILVALEDPITARSFHLGACLSSAHLYLDFVAASEVH